MSREAITPPVVEDASARRALIAGGLLALFLVALLAFSCGVQAGIALGRADRSGCSPR